GCGPRTPSSKTPVGRISVAQYIESACPNCNRPVRIRTEYLGKRIACKSCDHTFKADAAQIPPASTPQAAPEESPIVNQQTASLEEELKQVRNELAVRTTEHVGIE